MRLPLTASRKTPIRITCFEPGQVAKSELVSDAAKSWVSANGFDGQQDKILTVPDENGGIGQVIFGLGSNPNPMRVGALAAKLPAASYQFDASSEFDAYLASLGWLLGGYRFSKYQSSQSGGEAKLRVDRQLDTTRLRREAEATYLARDLINTPANDMGPDELEKVVRGLARDHNATCRVTRGDALLKKNFPMIHAVGRASTSAPRLIDMKWGKASDPKLTLVGKGVIFDSGGLNIKPGNSMTLMKKDMGGAANVIALAKMIMDARLPVRLRLLVPTVENAISGNAFRPGDILPSRNGATVEIGNTDAEGRLILADALSLADEEKPELLIDMATLTGAARVALGPDLAPYYTHNEEIADALQQASAEILDPLWRMPLWAPYHSMLSSKIADVNHISTGGFAGSVTAALFLSRFVENAISWVHFDIYGWVPTAKPWAPVGGEAQGIRTLFKVIEEKFRN